MRKIKTVLKKSPRKATRKSLKKVSVRTKKGVLLGESASVFLSRTDGNTTGSYVFNKELNRVVKISSAIPKVASHGSEATSEDVGPCGREECGGGSCAMPPGDFN